MEDKATVYVIEPDDAVRDSIIISNFKCVLAPPHVEPDPECVGSCGAAAGGMVVKMQPAPLRAGRCRAISRAASALARWALQPRAWPHERSAGRARI
jgi:hypothetical protein